MPTESRFNWKYAFLISVIVLIITVQFLFLHGGTSSPVVSTADPVTRASIDVNPKYAEDEKISSQNEHSAIDVSNKLGQQISAVKPRQNLASKKEPLIIVSKPLTSTSASSQSMQSETVHQHVNNGNLGRLLASPMSWNQFSHLPYNEHFEKSSKDKVQIVQKPLITCPANVVEELAKPRLKDEDFKWCQWALSSTGGKVIVGKSWGKLSSKSEKEKFDLLNCNSVSQGKNPSCDDSWGDVHIRTWQKNIMDALRCGKTKSSDLICHKNDNNDVYCVMKNAQINFSKMKKVSRGGGMTPSKTFKNNFISADCKDDVHVEDSFPFPHLYSPQLSSQTCDYVYNGTLLMYSHDDIRNLGHTLNDVFNIWIMLWMQNIARYEHQIEMLNIDSFKLGHNFDDQPNAFFTTYYKSLRGILKGIDFQDKTLCVKNLMIQPIPPRFFIWESWFVDLPCSFVGPSALYQRWNLDVRHNYGLLNVHHPANMKRKVLLVIRNEHSNMWGSQRTSRNYLNTAEILAGVKALVQEAEFEADYELVGIDLSKLSFQEQLHLISESGIMVGMHGAGMSSSMHMSVGEPKCCGVLEMFPAGEFSPIKGHGNMVRKMGIYYDRFDIDGKDSQGNGATVPVNVLVARLRQMMQQVREKPSCVLDGVIQDPFLEN